MNGQAMLSLMESALQDTIRRERAHIERVKRHLRWASGEELCPYPYETFFRCETHGDFKTTRYHGRQEVQLERLVYNCKTLPSWTLQAGEWRETCPLCAAKMPWILERDRCASKML